MMESMNAVDFQTRLTSILETLAKRAVAEIDKLFQENCLLLRLEISRCTRVNGSLQQKCHYLETELQAARKTAAKMKRNEASFTHSALMTDSGHHPASNSIFDREWSMNTWKNEESNVGHHENTHLDSSVNTVESADLLDIEPDMILIKEEVLEDCSGKNKTEEDQSTSSRGPAVGSDDGCSAENSSDFITYTIPSDDQMQSDVQQRPLTHEDSTTETPFSPIQNQTSIIEESRFDCDFCGKTFNKLSYLKVHMRTHTGEKPFSCTVCGKRFAQKTYLRIHQRIHSGERPYTCMDCGKGFAQKSALNVHLRSHTGEKPYSCVECGKSYTYKQCFNAHPCVRLAQTQVDDY